MVTEPGKCSPSSGPTRAASGLAVLPDPISCSLLSPIYFCRFACLSIMKPNNRTIKCRSILVSLVGDFSNQRVLSNDGFKSSHKIRIGQAAMQFGCIRRVL